MKTLLYLIIFTFITIFLANHLVLAQSAPQKEGWYCKNNAVWHILPKPDSTGATEKISRTCGADEKCIAYKAGPYDIYSGEASCANIGAQDPGKSVIILPSPNPVNFQQDVKLSFTSDSSCKAELDENKIVNDDPNKSNLQMAGILDGCKVNKDSNGEYLHCGCDKKYEHHKKQGPDDTQEWDESDCGPDDWHSPSVTDPKTGKPRGVNPYNNKQCYVDVSCKAEGVNAFDIAFNTANPACNTFVNVAINYQNSCDPNPNTTDAQNTDPDHLTNPSIDDDLINTQLILDNSAPGSVSQHAQATYNNEKPDKQPSTFVDLGFIRQGIKNFVCNTKIPIPFIKDLVACQVGFNINVDHFNAAFERTQSTANLERPNLTYPEATADCNLFDKKSNGDKEVQVDDGGYEKYRQTATAIAGTGGWCGNLLPSQISKSVTYDKSRTISLDGKNTNDMSGPQAEALCDLASRSMYAPGITIENTQTTNNRSATGQQSCKPRPLEEYQTKYGFNKDSNSSYPFDKPNKFMPDFLTLKSKAVQWSWIFNVDPMMVVWWNFFETGAHNSYNWSLCGSERKQSGIGDCDQTYNGGWQLGYGQQFGTYLLLPDAFKKVYVEPLQISTDQDIAKKTQEVGQSVLDKSGETGTKFPLLTPDALIQVYQESDDANTRANARYMLSVLERDPDLSVYLLSAALKGVTGDTIKSWPPGTYYQDHWQEASNLFADIWQLWNSTSSSSDQVCQGNP